jgi:four helix bundle protein
LLKKQMLLLDHKRLEVYLHINEVIKELYILSKQMPPDERFGLIPQLRRAVMSIKLNLAEGSARRSKSERYRFYEIARSSLVEVDAVLETTIQLNYLSENSLASVFDHNIKIFVMLTGLMRASK